MQPREFIRDVYSVGYIDWDRRLFDALIPLPDGTSYNSYLVKGSEKIALIDTVDLTLPQNLLANLESLGVKQIDYLVCNHAEPDHSGSIPNVLVKYPSAMVVCTERCKTMLVDLFGIAADRFKVVADKEIISLGGKTLEFIYLPWVHWPETMATYLREDKILFSCDFLGSHLATTDLFVTDEGQMLEAAKRYYAEIMMPFRTNIQKNLEKLQGYAINIIAPSHGPMHNKPEVILNAYHAWAFDEPHNTVVIPYTSMHGSTQKMVDYLVSSLAKRGVKVEQFELSVTDIGKLAISLVDAGTIVIGTPTVLTQPHPIALYATILANALKPKVKFASVIGSYGWGGKTVETITGLIPNLKVEILTPVYIKGQPKDADYQALDVLAETIARKHKEAGLK